MIAFVIWQLARITRASKLRVSLERYIDRLRRLIHWFWALLHGLGRMGAEGMRVLVSRFQNRSDLAHPPLRRTVLQRLGPRQRVEHYYLALLKRAARLGYERTPARPHPNLRWPFSPTSQRQLQT